MLTNKVTKANFASFRLFTVGSNNCHRFALFQIYINLEMTLQLQFNFVPREFALDITGSILIAVQQRREDTTQISSVGFCHFDCI